MSREIVRWGRDLISADMQKIGLPVWETHQSQNAAGELKWVYHDNDCKYSCFGKENFSMIS